MYSMKTCIVMLITIVALGVGNVVSGCGDTDADVASHNLSQEAEQFHVQRRVVVYNGITDKVISTIEGLCSIETPEGQRKLEVTCKTSDGYYKNFYGLSDNVSYALQQLEDVGVSTSHYKVIIKPSAVIPDIEIP